MARCGLDAHTRKRQAELEALHAQLPNGLQNKIVVTSVCDPRVLSPHDLHYYVDSDDKQLRPNYIPDLVCGRQYVLGRAIRSLKPALDVLQNDDDYRNYYCVSNLFGSLGADRAQQHLNQRH